MKENRIGNTQRGVSRAVVETLKQRADCRPGTKLIDAPCGNGEFALYLAEKFPGINITGIDYFADATGKVAAFHKINIHEFFRTVKPKDVDIITCISGVMCFDGIEELFSSFGKSLKANGLLVVTNDNFMTLRDRINFLFLGRFKRFKLCNEVNEGNWNIVSPQGIVMLLQRQGFRGLQIKYTSIYAEDYFLIPLAILIYPVFLAYLVLHKSSMPKSMRLALFPFTSMIARHYIISAKLPD